MGEVEKILISQVFRRGQFCIDVYNITILESPKSLRILWLISHISPNFANVGYNKLTTLSLERGTSVRFTKKLCTSIVIDFSEY